MGQLKIGLYGRSGIKNIEGLKLLIQTLQQNAELHIYKPFQSYLQKTLKIKINSKSFTSSSDIDKSIDCFISVGGDGTFLESAQFVVEHNIPILGFNFGRLGFLAQVSADDIKPALESLFNREYDIENRNLMNVFENDIQHDFYALNEVTIQRKTPAMITTTVWINNDLLSSYWSDGILFSTPTGSTAYSLSVGGPILLPDTHNFVISPIASHNLNIRPIVVSDNSEITVEVSTRKGVAATLSMDNKMKNIASGTKIKIKKSKLTLNFIKLNDYNFLKMLYTKLNWGRDIRN